MISSVDSQSWVTRQAYPRDSIPSDGEYEVEEVETKMKRSKFSVQRMGFGKLVYCFIVFEAHSPVLCDKQGISGPLILR